MKLFTGKKNKGSLSISINAIVVLVMAMVVLGLGLTFIRNLIESGQEQLGRAIDNAELKNPASPGNEITVDRQVTFRKGDSGVVNIGWYNSDSSPSTVKPASSTGEYSINCLHESGGEKVFNLVAPEAQVAGGTAQGWQAIIKNADVDAPTGRYTCPIVIFGQIGDTNNQVLKSASTIVYLEN